MCHEYIEGSILQINAVRAICRYETDKNLYLSVVSDSKEGWKQLNEAATRTTSAWQQHLTHACEKLAVHQKHRTLCFMTVQCLDKQYVFSWHLHIVSPTIKCGRQRWQQGRHFNYGILPEEGRVEKKVAQFESTHSMMCHILVFERTEQIRKDISVLFGSSLKEGKNMARKRWANPILSPPQK